MASPFEEDIPSAEKQNPFDFKHIQEQQSSSRI
jgi:hypothetical protein